MLQRVKENGELELLVDMTDDGDIVFCHGDFFLPKIFIDNRQVSGFLDLGLLLLQSLERHRSTFGFNAYELWLL